jgi:hypothetical protein
LKKSQIFGNHKSFVEGKIYLKKGKENKRKENLLSPLSIHSQEVTSKLMSLMRWCTCSGRLSDLQIKE